MTPERIAELRRQCTGATWPKLTCAETMDLLATAEREAALREAANVLSGAYSTSEYHRGMKMLRAALEKGGGS